MSVLSRRRNADLPDAVITTARRGRSHDLNTREVRYVWTMGIRIACFVAMAFVGGWGRWALLLAAAFLPGIAVLLANAIDKRGQLTVVIPETDPHHQLTAHTAEDAPTIIDHD